jgi:hypothetical protein
MLHQPVPVRYPCLVNRHEPDQRQSSVQDVPTTIRPTSRETPHDSRIWGWSVGVCGEGVGTLPPMSLRKGQVQELDIDECDVARSHLRSRSHHSS